MKILVTGGVRSGKSAHAEGLLAAAPSVLYVAPGPVPDGTDAAWAARVKAHRDRRPEGWATVETPDLVAAVAGFDRLAQQAVLVDDLSVWLAAQIDDLDGWDQPILEWDADLQGRIDAAVEALTQTEATVVLVTNEVGLGGIASHRSARLFADLLGTVNQRFAAVCDEVHLVIAGRVLKL